MKNVKLFFAIVFVLVAASVAIISSSCSSNSCGSVVCLNGGSCSSGKCQCPTGFSGARCQTRANSAIMYTNNTFTPITIVVNGTSKTVPAGTSVAFAGQYASQAVMTASTSGNSGSLANSNPSGLVGLTLNWGRTDSFPITDTLRIPLDIGPTYFFLRMQNNDPKNIIDFYVNINFPGPNEEIFQDVTIPNNRVVYDMGYYLAFSSSNVQVQTSDSRVIWKAVTLPFTNNQSCTISIP